MILKNGFSCTVDEAALDDWDVFEIICAVDSGDVAKLPAMIKAFLGAEQCAALVEHIKKTSPTGKCSVSAMSEVIAEVMEGLKAGKK